MLFEGCKRKLQEEHYLGDNHLPGPLLLFKAGWQKCMVGGNVRQNQTTILHTNPLLMLVSKAQTPWMDSSISR